MPSTTDQKISLARCMITSKTPPPGLEPGTIRLTAERSTTELKRNVLLLFFQKHSNPGVNEKPVGSHDFSIRQSQICAIVTLDFDLHLWVARDSNPDFVG